MRHDLVKLKLTVASSLRIKFMNTLLRVSVNLSTQSWWTHVWHANHIRCEHTIKAHTNYNEFGSADGFIPKSPSPLLPFAFSVHVNALKNTTLLKSTSQIIYCWNTCGNLALLMIWTELVDHERPRGQRGLNKINQKWTFYFFAELVENWQTGSLEDISSNGIKPDNKKLFNWTK